MNTAAIKSKAEYEDALAEVDRLIDVDPDPDTPEADRLERLTVLVETYEAETSTLELPDPIDAIRFRMDQQGLSQRDLAPIIGSRSRVSEILSRKRPLTLAMIRALHSNLGIPPAVLLQKSSPRATETADLDWSKFPLREMAKKGWVTHASRSAENRTDSIIRGFFAPLGSVTEVTALFRGARLNTRSARHMNPYALAAWTAKVIMSAKETPPPMSYAKGSVTHKMMRAVARLSLLESGPLLAREYLSKNGVSLVILPHLQGTYLDGAAILWENDTPVIGLTLRYDRLDNFWFCLMHEMAHIHLHLDADNRAFYDDLYDDPKNDEQGDTREQEADNLASEILIPAKVWAKSVARSNPRPQAVREFARELGIHPAIVAGRIRHESRSFRLLSNMVGHRRVRRLFTEQSW